MKTPKDISKDEKLSFLHLENKVDKIERETDWGNRKDKEGKGIENASQVSETFDKTGRRKKYSFGWRTSWIKRCFL